MRTVEQIIEQARLSESEFVANTIAEELAGATSTAEAIEILLRAGISGAKVFKWADVSVQEARELITDRDLLAEGNAERGSIDVLEDERVNATFDQQEDEESAAAGLPPGAERVTDLVFDDAGQQIVARLEDGTRLVVSPVTGQLVPGIFAEGDEPPSFLGGLPEDYAVIDGDQITTFERGLPGDPATIDAVWDAINTPRPPRYREGDQLDFAEFSVERRAAVSEALVAAGFLDQDIYDVYGASWTSDHARAMAEAMTEANIAGKTWSSLVQRRAQQIEDAGGLPGTGAERGRVFVMPARREPDFASLAQDVKAVMRSRLERDPLDWELSLLADEMQDAYRSQYDAEVQAARQEFDAGNHATAQAEGGQDVFTSAGTVQEVDPIARFRESFEQRYADEIELTEDRAAGLDNISNVFSKLTSVTRMMGG